MKSLWTVDDGTHVDSVSEGREANDLTRPVDPDQRAAGEVWAVAGLLTELRAGCRRREREIVVGKTRSRNGCHSTRRTKVRRLLDPTKFAGMRCLPASTGVGASDYFPD